MSGEMTDLAELARAAAAGDKAAASAFLEGIQDDVYELALRMLGHPADAEDAAQEILVIVITHLGSFRGESSVKTWVWRRSTSTRRRIASGSRERGSSCTSSCAAGAECSPPPIPVAARSSSSARSIGGCSGGANGKIVVMGLGVAC
jgi:DNA-directed RNA polymerase specialized sigma24 family protein